MTGLRALFPPTQNPVACSSLHVRPLRAKNVSFPPSGFPECQWCLLVPMPGFTKGFKLIASHELRLPGDSFPAAGPVIAHVTAKVSVPETLARTSVKNQTSPVGGTGQSTPVPELRNVMGNPVCCLLRQKFLVSWPGPGVTGPSDCISCANSGEESSKRSSLEPRAPVWGFHHDPLCSPLPGCTGVLWCP